MDQLDERIAESRREIAAMDAAIDDLAGRRARAALRLEVFEEAASLRPLVGRAPRAPHTNATDKESSQRKKGGRPISPEWRLTLVAMDDEYPTVGCLYEDIFRIARGFGIKGTEHSSRDRVRKYQERLHLLDRIGDKFRVKPEIADRFRAELGKPKIHQQALIPETLPEPQPITIDQREPANVAE